jgi:hypothetical protein
MGFEALAVPAITGLTSGLFSGLLGSGGAAGAAAPLAGAAGSIGAPLTAGAAGAAPLSQLFGQQLGTGAKDLFGNIADQALTQFALGALFPNNQQAFPVSTGAPPDIPVPPPTDIGSLPLSGQRGDLGVPLSLQGLGGDRFGGPVRPPGSWWQQLLGSR